MLNVSKKLSKDCEKICFQECSKIAQSGRTFLEGTIVTSVTRLGNFLHFGNNSKPVAMILIWSHCMLPTCDRPTILGTVIFPLGQIYFF